MEMNDAPSMNTPSESLYGNCSNDTGDFECNICFELAHDPIVTLCGHLFCWPCLYKWLNFHSHSHECPVCKALIQEEKLVPLYGRGKTSSDPRSRSIPGIEIPHRPSGQRPETAPPHNPNSYPQQGFGAWGGPVPMSNMRLGNLSLSFGGLIPSLLNFQAHGFHDATVYGTTSGYPYSFFNSYHGGHAHGFHYHSTHHRRPSEANVLKTCLLVFGFILVLSLICPLPI